MMLMMIRIMMLMMIRIMMLMIMIMMMMIMMMMMMTIPRSGSLMMIMSGCRPTYYPDLSMATFLVTFLLSRISGLLGNKVTTVPSLAILASIILLLCAYIFHIVLSAVGL